MDYAVLYAEITTDPLGRGYAGMSDAEIAADMNAATRTRHRETLTPTEIINAVVLSEWNSRTAAQQQLIWNLLHMGEINPFGIEAEIFVSVFGGQSATIAALAALRTESISRAQELGLPTVSVGYIQKARAYGEEN